MPGHISCFEGHVTETFHISNIIIVKHSCFERDVSETFHVSNVTFLKHCLDTQHPFSCAWSHIAGITRVLVDLFRLVGQGI